MIAATIKQILLNKSFSKSITIPLQIFQIEAQTSDKIYVHNLDLNIKEQLQKNVKSEKKNPKKHVIFLNNQHIATSSSFINVVITLDL